MEIGFQIVFAAGDRALRDQDLGVISSWGLVNDSNPEVPHPTALIIDAGGSIRCFRQDVDYRPRPSVEEPRGALADIKQPVSIIGRSPRSWQSGCHPCGDYFAALAAFFVALFAFFSLGESFFLLVFSFLT